MGKHKKEGQKVSAVSNAFLSARKTAHEQNKQKSLLSQGLHSSLGNAHLQSSKSLKQLSANISIPSEAIPVMICIHWATSD